MTVPPAGEVARYRFEPAEAADSARALARLLTNAAECVGALRRVVAARRLPANDLATRPAAVVLVAEFAADADVWRLQSVLDVALGQSPARGRRRGRGPAPYQAGALAGWSSPTEAGSLVLQSSFDAFTFLYALSTQTGLGWSPMHAALVLLPIASCFFIVSIWSGRLAPRFGFRRLLMIGAVVQATLLGVTATSVILQGVDLNSSSLAAVWSESASARP